MLYLIHVPALLILGSSERHLGLLRFVPPWLLAGVFIALIVGVALLLNRMVEKPLLRLLRPAPAPTSADPVAALS